jgi:inorganic pyrophosphatase
VTAPSPTLAIALALRGRQVSVDIDRPLGSVHPRLGYPYPVNYGEPPEIRAPDGGGLDAYVLGPQVPLARARGRVVAVIERIGEDDPKLVVATPGAYASACGSRRP